MIAFLGKIQTGGLTLMAGVLAIVSATPAQAQGADPMLPVPGLAEQMTGQQQDSAPSSSSGSSRLDAIRARAQGQNAPSGQQQAPAKTGDALPDVRNVRVQTEGMDYLGTSTVDLELRDIPVETNDELFQQSIRDEAFDSAADGMFPLSTGEIREILRRYDETRRAVEMPHYELPIPQVKVENISLDPGVVPPVINTAVGHVTTLTILDVTGAPWPIQDVSWAGDFEVVEPEEGGHIIRITPMANFAYGNISMRLLTLKTPITFTLRTTRDVVQYRLDARIPEYGPMASAPLIEGASQVVAGDKVLTQILDGMVPADAERLDVAGVDGRTTALQIGATTYLRTPLTLLSPAWDSSVKSADGMNVYAMAETPVVLLSDAGTFRRATLRPREGLFDE
jgi:intracellular multiplication protein IcmK